MTYTKAEKTNEKQDRAIKLDGILSDPTLADIPDGDPRRI